MWKSHHFINHVPREAMGCPHLSLTMFIRSGKWLVNGCKLLSFFNGKLNGDLVSRGIAQVSGIIPDLPGGDQHLPTQRSLCHPFHLFNFDGGGAETPSTRRLGVGRLSEVVGPGWLCAATREVPGKRHLVRLVEIPGDRRIYKFHQISILPMKQAHNLSKLHWVTQGPILTCVLSSQISPSSTSLLIFSILVIH